MTGAAKLDPRTKLFLIACLSSSAVLITHWALLGGLFAVSLLLLLLFRVSPRDMLKKTKALLSMVVFIAVMQSIFTPTGQAMVTIGSLKLVTTGGLTAAGEFILRMLIIVASAGILSTSNSREIIQGLVQWKMPYELAFMASMGIRFLPVFAEEFQNAKIAIELRGVDLKALPLRQKIEVMASMFQPVVGGALIKSRAIAMSIEMRGFRACPTRTSYRSLEATWQDYGVMIVSGLLTVLIMVWYFF